MSAPENPPAFPSPVHHSRPRGMTLRDYFAGQALASLLQVRSDHAESAFAGFEGLAAQDAYRFADAMLAERSK